MDEKHLSKVAGISPQAAKIALREDRWKNWLEERKHETEVTARLNNLRMVSGAYVNEDKYEDRAVIIQMYEDYLRMAQMDQRSKTTFIIQNGQQVGKPVISMTFEEYLRDALKNLDWRINVDVPQMRRIEERGGIGISKEEGELTIRLCLRVKESITKFFELPETQRLIYV